MLALQTIRLDTIVGTAGARRDFDSCFRPASGRVRSRWEQLIDAYVTQVLTTVPPKNQTARLLALTRRAGRVLRDQWPGSYLNESWSLVR